MAQLLAFFRSVGLQPPTRAVKRDLAGQLRRLTQQGFAYWQSGQLNNWPDHNCLLEGAWWKLDGFTFRVAMLSPKTPILGVFHSALLPRQQQPQSLFTIRTRDCGIGPLLRAVLAQLAASRPPSGRMKQGPGYADRKKLQQLVWEIASSAIRQELAQTFSLLEV